MMSSQRHSDLDIDATGKHSNHGGNDIGACRERGIKALLGSNEMPRIANQGIYHTFVRLHWNSVRAFLPSKLS